MRKLALLGLFMAAVTLLKYLPQDQLPCQTRYAEETSTPPGPLYPPPRPHRKLHYAEQSLSYENASTNTKKAAQPAGGRGRFH